LSKSLVNFDKYRTPKPKWIGYVLLCADGAYYVGVTGYSEACWTAHANRQHPFTRQHGLNAVLELYKAPTKAKALWWQRQTTLDLIRRYPGRVVGGSHGAQTVIAKPWSYPKRKKSTRRTIPTIPS